MSKSTAKSAAPPKKVVNKPAAAPRPSRAKPLPKKVAKSAAKPPAKAAKTTRAGTAAKAPAKTKTAAKVPARKPVKAPVRSATIGILYVGTLEQPFTDFRNKVIWLFLAIALAGLSVTLLFGYLLAGSITRPLTKLVGVTHEISRGHPKEIPIYTRDEIGHLAQSFVQMSQNLEHTMNDLKELNKKYLGLLGFTTHELKQPLGVLRGYVLMLCDETLGKLTTPVQKEALLEMKNSVNALQEMITKYLQLTKIESGQVVADKRIINLYSESIRPVLEGEASHIAVQNMQVAFEQKSALEKLVLTADPALMRIVYSNPSPMP